MNKIGAVITVVVLVIAAYLLLLVVMPIITQTASSANAAMDASSNMSLYPGTSGMLMSSSWILFFAPGVIGIAVVIILLRTPSS